MKDGVKIVVIGGGSTYTPELVQGLIDRHDEMPIEELWLVDIESGSEKLSIISTFCKRLYKQAKIDVSIHTTLNRVEALQDADYVITQLRVGGLKARVIDETIPAKYNLLGQESIGIGGCFQALRTVPIIWDIIAEMKEHCPSAWLINVSNPTGIISEAVFRYSEFDRYIGISTITNYMANFFANQLDAKEKDIIPYFIGLYQMSFVRSVFYKHRNNLQDILETMDESKFRFKNDDTPPWDASFIKQLGAYPGPYLKYYYHYDEMLQRYKERASNHQTRAEEVLAMEQDLLQQYQQSNEPIRIERGGKYYSDVACSVMSSIYNDKRDYHVLITPNNRVTTDVPQDSAIEVTCRVTKHGPVPVYIGTLPTEIKGIIQQMKAYEELLVDAIYEQDLDKAHFAFTANPLCTSIQQSKQAFQALIEEHQAYLTYYNKE